MRKVLEIMTIFSTMILAMACKDATIKLFFSYTLIRSFRYKVLFVHSHSFYGFRTGQELQITRWSGRYFMKFLACNPKPIMSGAGTVLGFTTGDGSKTEYPEHTQWDSPGRLRSLIYAVPSESLLCVICDSLLTKSEPNVTIYFSFLL